MEILKNESETVISSVESELQHDSTWLKLCQNKNTTQICQWNNTISYHTLLIALCIDSKNAVLGPRWSSEVPRFAVSLKFTPLIPEKTPCTSVFDHTATLVSQNNAYNYDIDEVEKSYQYDVPPLSNEIIQKEVSPLHESWIDVDVGSNVGETDNVEVLPKNDVDADAVLKIINSLPDLSVLSSKFIIPHVRSH